MNHKQFSAKGGTAGRGAAKARTSEQARAAAQARWEKQRRIEKEAAKLHALSSPNKRPSDTSESSCL